MSIAVSYAPSSAHTHPSPQRLAIGRIHRQRNAKTSVVTPASSTDARYRNTLLDERQGHRPRASPSRTSWARSRTPKRVVPVLFTLHDAPHDHRRAVGEVEDRRRHDSSTRMPNERTATSSAAPYAGHPCVHPAAPPGHPASTSAGHMTTGSHRRVMQIVVRGAHVWNAPVLGSRIRARRCGQCHVLVVTVAVEVDEERIGDPRQRAALVEVARSTLGGRLIETVHEPPNGQRETVPHAWHRFVCTPSEDVVRCHGKEWLESAVVP